jgi:hypothetical protein
LIYDKVKLENVEKEGQYIKNVLHRDYPDVLTDELIQNLYNINKKLWAIEDDIRDCESRKDFSEKFIELARSVYKTNDVRAIIKKQINEKYNSEFIEEKSYHSV